MPFKVKCGKPTPPSTPTPTPAPVKEDGLPFWAIALIVVGALALIVGVAATCYIFRESICGIRE